MSRRGITAGIILLVMAFLPIESALGEAPKVLSPQPAGGIQGPFVGPVVVPSVSRAARDLPLATDKLAAPAYVPPRQNPLGFGPDSSTGDTSRPAARELDPLLMAGVASGRTPDLDFVFDATGNPAACGGCKPSDANGDVGPNHYVHIVNATKVAIYSKSGTLLSGPFNLSSLWSVGNCTSDLGDPIVLYDPLADRWLLSQFATPNDVCIAISQTANPTGAYHTYDFNTVSFPDYMKFGVWPDAYYMSANESTYTAYALPRESMLLGLPASYLKFTGMTNMLMPADLDGHMRPPVGSPGIFYTFKDDSYHGGADRLELYSFHVDWATPANSTFTGPADVPISSFTYTVCGFFVFNCIRQLDTVARFDAVSEWPMFRFPYRNFGSFESLVGSFVVGGGRGEEGAAIRWFELRRAVPPWLLYQEGTQDPADGHDRSNPSIAMDQKGNIALGYTVSSSAIHPQIRYATRLASDPLGTLQAEAFVVAPAGSQTSGSRWGDYSAMAVDPADDCSFWYTNQYYAANSAGNWSTAVGVFTIPSCLPGYLNLPLVLR